MSRRIVATIPDELAERLASHMDAQEVEPTISALVNGALRSFLGRSNTRRPPDWTPICPKCGWDGIWLPFSRLIAVCGTCGHASEGEYPDQDGHEYIAEHWRGLDPPANEKPLPDQEREVQRTVLRQRAITLGEALGRSVSFAETAEALAKGFSLALNLRLVPGHLSDAERAAMAPLRHKHVRDEWLYER